MFRVGLCRILISENSVTAKFAFWGFSEDEMRRPTPEVRSALRGLQSFDGL